MVLAKEKRLDNWILASLSFYSFLSVLAWGVFTLFVFLITYKRERGRTPEWLCSENATGTIRAWTGRQRRWHLRKGGGGWEGGLAGSSKVRERGKVEAEPGSQVRCGWCGGVWEEWLSKQHLWWSAQAQRGWGWSGRVAPLNSVGQRGSESSQCLFLQSCVWEDLAPLSWGAN